MPRKSVFAALVCASAIAPAFADPVAFPFTPEKGASWTVTETRSRSTNQAGKQPLTEATTIGRLTVIEETDEGYLMEWLIESLSTGGITITEDDGLTQFYIGVPVRFETDASGAPLEIHEAENFVDAVMKMVVDAAGSPDPQVAALTRQMLSAPEMLISSLLPQAALIGNCQGFELEPGQTLRFDSEAPNIVGGPPIPTVNTITLEDAGSGTRPALIRIVESYDPEEAGKAVMTALRSMAAQRNLPPPAGSENIPALSRVSEIVCHVDADTGEALKVSMDMKAEADTMRRQDVRNIVIARRN